MKNRGRTRRGAVAGALALAASMANAQAAQTTPAALIAGFERTELPGGEHMGLAQIAYLVEFAPGWRAGPALYGAATGHRGGLFTWGAEAQKLWRFGERWQAVGGLYVGGGGGASAPVGGGLMLRPHADLLYGFDGWALGVSASQVRFPNGDIRSSQLGLVLSVDDRFEHGTPGVAWRGGEASWLRVDRLVFGGGSYAEQAPGDDSLGIVSLRAEHDLGPVWIATAEAGAAVQGDGDGYAEFGAGLAALWPTPLPGLRVGGRTMLGLGGGGAVPTGGGIIGKAALLARWQVAGPWSLELEGGRVHAFSGGDLDSNYAMLSLGRSFGAPDAGAPAVETEFALAAQSYDAQRRDGSRRRLETVGLKISRAIDERWYVAGQAYGAVTGGAGAYSVGLVGLGARWPVSPGWRVGAEALAGAAGGGGVESKGGAIVQPKVWVGTDVGRHGRLQLGAGYIRSLRGELSAPLVELSWGVALGRP